MEGKKISIIKVELSNNNEWIKIEIKDNGPGFQKINFQIYLIDFTV